MKIRILLLLIAFNLTACSNGSSGGNSTLSVSGTMGLSASASSNIVRGLRTVDITDYQVTCATTTAPITSGTSDIAADGTFELNVQGAANQPMACFLVDANGDKVADFLITDSSTKDLNGNDSTTTSATFSKSPDLGNISFDPDTGEVNVPATNVDDFISTLVPVASSVFDPTGSWTITDLNFTPPAGIKPPCDANDNNCHGPPSGQTIYLKLWKGLVTANDSNVYGLQVWDSPGQFAACGNKIGLTSAIKTALGIDFSANGSADNVFTFDSSVTGFTDQITSVTGTVNLTNNWKMDTATLQHDLMPLCGPHDITAGATTYANAWVCGPDSGSNYQAQLGGGCHRDSDNKNVDVRDWSGISCGMFSTDSDGIQSNTCTGTPTIDGVATAVTCSNKWAVVNSSYVVQPMATFNWNDMNGDIISSGTLCSAIANGASSDALKIAQLQCYGEYFYRSGMEHTSGVCLPRVDLDWSATTPTDFEKVDLIRPNGLVFFEKYNPYPDGSGGTMTTRQEHFEGVQVGNSWVNCRVIDTGSLSFKKVTANKLLATYQSSTITTSTSKPACLGKFNGARETFVFYLTK